jgi:hypothetical protein
MSRRNKENKQTECWLLVEPRVAHKVVEPSDISDGYIPFVRRCGVEQEVASNKARKAKGAESFPSVMRAKVVNKGQHEDRKLAMAGKKKKKVVSLEGSWLPKSVFMT